MPPKAKTAKTPENLSPAALKALINSKFGAGSMISGSDPSLEIERIPTGILSIDVLLNGGFARGRSVEVFGGYSVGKTYTSMCLMAQAQANGLRAAYVDCEGTFSQEFAEMAGVDLEELDYHRQESGPRVVGFIETLLRAGLHAVIVLDSIAALIPQDELDTDMEAGTFGTQQAKLMSKALRILTTANKSTILFFINQQRESVGSMFAKKMVTSGGRAMGFYASTRLEMVRIETIYRSGKIVDPKSHKEKDSDKLVKGHRVLVRVEKEKTGARPQAETTFVFDYDEGGVDPTEDLLFLGVKFNLIHNSGNSWWVEDYEDEKQGSKNKFKSWLGRNRAVSDELEDKIREAAADA